MKQDLREIKTERAVQEALIQLLNEKPRSQITISELAQRAMINRKTFYRHYGSIDDVFEQIENIIVDGILEICTPGGSDTIDLNLFFSGITNLLSENEEIYTTIIRDKSYESITAKIKDDITASFYRTIKKVSNADDNKIRIAAEFAVNGILGLYTSWIMHKEQYTLDELAETSREITINAISSLLDKNV